VRGVGLGSAESVLRSQGTLGQARHSRYRTRGILVSTFLCSLRPDSAAALCYGDSRGFALGELGLRGGDLVFWRSLGSVRGVGLGSAETVLRSQGTLGQARHSRYRTRGILVSTFLCSLRPDSAAMGTDLSVRTFWGS
jgi:hypothetical protein